jgi:hypothetical protein
MLFQASKSNPSGVYRVTVDDVDVTGVCFECDDLAGYANCWMWQSYPDNPPPGKPELVLENGERIVVQLTGKVVFAMRGGVHVVGAK